MPPDNDTMKYMQVLMDKVPSMIAYWDSDMRCRIANRAYQHWFGRSPESLLGTRIPDLLGPALFALNEGYIRAALRGEPQTFERIVPGPDGVQRNSLAQYIPHEVNGQVMGFVALVTEITEYKLVQAALQREQALRERIESAAIELGELLRERTAMLDVLAHEVRQPLNTASAAMQSAAAVLDSSTDLAASARLQQARAVLGQVLERVDNTLAVASLLTRSEAIALVDMEIDLMVTLALQDMPDTERRRIRVERATATRTVAMDAGLMRLALRNLLSNALRHGPAGTPVVLTLSDCEEPLALHIDVSDRGTGIPPERVPRLFERATPSPTPDGSAGRGIGLFIVRRVMELHGGHVELVTNRPGCTRVRLVLMQA